MFNIVSTEFSKFKRSAVLLLIPIGAALPVAMMVMAYLALSHQTFKLDMIFDTNLMLMNQALGTALFTLLSGYVFAREYSENTINTMFTYPINRAKFLISKLFIILTLIFLTFLLNFLFILLFNLILLHNPITLETLGKYGAVFLLSVLMQFALMPVSALLSIHGKSIIPSVALGISAVVCNILVINSSRYSIIFPWSVPVVLSSRLLSGAPMGDYLHGVISLILTFTVGLAASLLSYFKADVHSGS